MYRLLAPLVAGLVACPGVLVGPGNDFPCDFSKPPGARDAVCSPGDVCGVNDRCHRYQYEGPQFEGLPTFPQFTSEARAGVVLHPQLVKGRVDAVVKVVERSQFLARTADGLFLVGRASVSRFGLPDGGAVAPIEAGADLVVLPRDEGPVTSAADVIVLSRRRADSLAGQVEVYGTGRPVVLQDADGGALRAIALRVLPPARTAGQPAPRVAVLGTDFVGLVDGTGARPRFLPVTEPALDVAPGPREVGRPPIVLTRAGLAAPVDGGVQLVLPLAFEADGGARLASDETGSVFAVLTRAPPRLFTVVARATPGGIEAAAPWSDCEPCPLPRLATPGLDGRGPFVDVLCATRVQRLRGALATGACLEEPLEAPFFAGDLAGSGSAGPVIDEAAGTGFTGGGQNGQLWAGPTIGAATPLLMDRVPLDVGTLGLPDGTSAVFALTSAGLFDGRPERGYLAVAPDVPARVAALVNEGQGWVVAEGGALKKMLSDGRGRLAVQFGPRLVDGRGEPVTRPLRGEAFVSADGGLVSMLLAADDSLFFVPAPPPSDEAGALGDVAPVLTPEPSSFIRSVALERSPIGSNGVDRMRGYVVTARSVFEVKLGGAPLRWSATALAFSGGEPVEVWFDNPRGGLGRVGYRDGTVFTIPGGFQLTEPLPPTDGGAPIAVVDYENLGGWPVALTESGLFVARYDPLPSGYLDNRFPDGGVNKPMSWREVRLPDGSRPWTDRGRPRLGAQPARLFVLAEPAARVTTGDVTSYQRAFRLIVYLPSQVIEVGRHVRSNVSAQ